MRRRWAQTLPAVQPPPYLAPITYHKPLRPTMHYTFWKQAHFLSPTTQIPLTELKRALIGALGLRTHPPPCSAAPRPLMSHRFPVHRPGACVTCSRCCGFGPAAFSFPSPGGPFGLDTSDLRDPGDGPLASRWSNFGTYCLRCCNNYPKMRPPKPPSVVVAPPYTASGLP